MLLQSTATLRASLFVVSGEQLIIRPLSSPDESGCQSSYVLIVDALDECDNDNSIQIIIDLLAKARSLKAVRLQVFLTSRPKILI